MNIVLSPMAYNPAVDARFFYGNICQRLASVFMQDVVAEIRFAWNYAHTMAMQYGDAWHTLQIDLPSVKTDVTQELIDKLNLVRTMAPGWGTVLVMWPADRCIRHENGTPIYAYYTECEPDTDGYTLEGVLARFHFSQ